MCRSPSPNQPPSQGRSLETTAADKTEAGGRPGAGRRDDPEPRHDYLSKSFIDGGRRKEGIQLEIPLREVEVCITFSEHLSSSCHSWPNNETEDKTD